MDNMDRAIWKENLKGWAALAVVIAIVLVGMWVWDRSGLRVEIYRETAPDAALAQLSDEELLERLRDSSSADMSDRIDELEALVHKLEVDAFILSRRLDGLDQLVSLHSRYMEIRPLDEVPPLE